MSARDTPHLLSLGIPNQRLRGASPRRRFSSVGDRRLRGSARLETVGAAGGEGDDTRNALAVAQRHRYNSLGLFLGGRLMASAFDQLADGQALGVAGELGVQWRWGSFAGSLGGHLMYLADRDVDISMSEARRYLPTLELGPTLRLAYEGEGSVANGIELAPQAGAYVRTSFNHWTNDFAAPGTATDIWGVRTEVGIYASGHFLEGFSGMVSVSALIPYGVASFEDLTWVITFAPTFAGPLDNGGQPTGAQTPSREQPAAPEGVNDSETGPLRI